MKDTKKEIASDLKSVLHKTLEELLMKLQDAVNTEVVTGSTSMSTQSYYTGKAELVRSVEVLLNNFNWTMTMRLVNQEPSSASIATQDLDSLKIPSQT